MANFSLGFDPGRLHGIFDPRIYPLVFPPRFPPNFPPPDFHLDIVRIRHRVFWILEKLDIASFVHSQNRHSVLQSIFQLTEAETIFSASKTFPSHFGQQSCSPFSALMTQVSTVALASISSSVLYMLGIDELRLLNQKKNE